MTKENPYIILDFETGGLDSKKNAITQLGMYCVDGATLQEIGRYQTYVSPYLYQYDQKALDYTGITMQLLNLKGESIKEVAKTVFTLIKEWHVKANGGTHTKKPVIIGHNIKFDIGFLQQLAKEGGYQLNTYLDGQVDFYGNYQPAYLDTMYISKLAHAADKNFTSYTLGKCCEKMGVELIDAHNAMGDVIGTKELLIKYVNRLRADDSRNTNTTGRIRLRENFHFKIKELDE